MSDKVEIKDIRIAVGDKELFLTLKQARELKDVLGKLLGEDHTKEIITYPFTPQPTPYIKSPWVTPNSPSINPCPDTYITWCNTSGTSTDCKVTFSKTDASATISLGS